MKFWTGFPRVGGALAALMLFLAVGARAEMTNVLSDAEIQGRKLAQQLCDARPQTNFTQSGILNIRDGKGNKSEFLVEIKVDVGPKNWVSIYKRSKKDDTNNFEGFIISHTDKQRSRYEDLRSAFRYYDGLLDGSVFSGSINMTSSFFGSDFWLCDLGLEFFHWPAQKILPKSTNLKRGREYTLLESTNPNPPTNVYSRVLSWIDKESGGILAAEAYDAHGEKLKEFEPKSFKKVNGQWELSEMEIRNVQTGSRTRLEFDLKSN